MLLTFPFSAPSLFTTNWLCFPILITSLYPITFLKYTLRKKTFFKNITAIIPASNFEWVSGFRKSFLLLIPLYVLAAGFCWLRFLPLLLLFFTTIVIVGFYNECESLQMVREGSFSSETFLKQKLLRNCIYLLLLYIPILLINALFNAEYLFINSFFMLTQLSMVCFSICFKYANYQPNQDAATNNVTVLVVSLCSIIPYLLPIPLIMAFSYYGKAKNNLTHYLND